MKGRHFKSGKNHFYYSRFCSIFSKWGEPKNISEVLERIAAKYPEKDAIVCDHVRCTFRQLKDQAARLANGLSAMGVSRGDWVAVMLPNCPEFVISFFAIAGIGGVVVPVDIYYRQPELKRIMLDGHVATLITSAEYLDIAEQTVRECPGFKNLILKENKAKDYPGLEAMLNTGEEAERMAPKTGLSKIRLPKIRLPKIKLKDDLLYLYTSGTTGMPKGVVLRHARVIAIGRAWRKRFPLTDKDKCYTLAPLFRSPALLSVIVSGVYYGITMVIPSAFRPRQVWEQIVSENISFLHANPFHFAALANLPLEENRKLPALKLCYSSGNRLSPRVAEKFLDRYGVKIEERYGTLEAGGICRNGRPLGKVRIKLIDEKGKKIKENGRMGEIVVKTSMMVKEYHNLPELSRKVFRNGWFHTGDIGKIDQQGKLHILYRKKTVVLIDGKEVYPDEVERVLLSHPKVKDVRVVKDRPKPGSAAIKAIVVLKEPCSQEVLLEFCRSRLDPYKTPYLIEFREELPRSWKTAVDAGQAYPMWGEF